MTPTDPLAQHLAETLGTVRGTTFWAYQMADKIREDPQRLVDALVEAGALEESNNPSGSWKRPAYQVVQPKPPHGHLWELTSHTTEQVIIRCVGCKHVEALDLP